MTIEELLKSSASKPWQIENEEYFKGALSVFKWIKTEIRDKQIFASDRLTLKQNSDCEAIALSGIFASSMRSFGRIISLAWDGDGETCMMLARTVFENSLNALLIKQNSENGELFLHFAAIEHKAVLDKFNSCNSDGEKTLPELKVEETYNEWAGKFTGRKNKVRNNWHSISDRFQRAELVGLKGHYELGFKRYSDVIHGGSMNILDHAKLNKTGDWEFLCVPSYKNIPEVLTESTKLFLIVYAAYAHKMGFSVKNGDLKEGYRSLANHVDFQVCFSKNKWLESWVKEQEKVA